MNPDFVVRKLFQAVESLAQFPDRGRAGQQPGTRELIMAPLPYVIVYRVRAGESVSVARIVHTAQNWRPS